MLVRVRFAIPGRIRWETSALCDRPEMALAIEQAFQTRRGVTSVHANPVTGRVLVICRQDVGIEELTVLLSNLSDCVPRPSALVKTRSLLIELLLNKQHRKLAALSLGMAFLHRLFEGLRPVMVGVALSVLTQRSGSSPGMFGLRRMRSQVVALGLLGLTVWALDAAASYLHSVTSASLANNIEHDLRSLLYEHLQRLDSSSLENHSVSEWMTILQDDVSRISKFIREELDNTLGMFASGLIAATTFSILAPKLAIIQLLTMPGVYFISTGFLKLIRRREQIVRQHQGELSTLLHGNISGMTTIVSFANQETEAQKVEAVSAKLMASTRHASTLSAAYVPAIQMCVGTGLVTTLVWGGVLVKRGSLSSSAYNVLGISSLRFLAALGRLGVYLDSYERTKISTRRISQFLEQESTITPGSRSLPPSSAMGDIVFKDVVFGYEKNRQVFPGLSLRFYSGQTTGIVGPSGAGKSTVLKLLLRLYDVQAGSIQIDGIDIRDFQIEDLRRAMAVVPQQAFLFAGTIRDNIAYAKPQSSLDEVKWAARAAEGHDFIEALPKGYETHIGERGFTLSGGQQQRLVIARSLLANRPILLFDEATSAIDHETEGAIHRSLQRIMPGRTTIVIAHRLATIRHADLIYVLDNGRVCESGRHEDLIRSDGVYANLWRVQIGEKSA